MADTDIKSHNFKLALLAAREAVLTSGKYLKKQFETQNHLIHFEGSHEKIDDDVNAENIILDILKKHLTDFEYISEETQNKTDSEIQFIIDPIEGTSNYARGVPFFATQIAILYQKKLSAAFIYEPIKDFLYHAIIGQGCFVNKQKCTIKQDLPLNKRLLSGGAGGDSQHKLLLAKMLVKLVPNFRSLRLYGSTGLELAYLAQGKLGLHIDNGSKNYDLLPGVLLIREAGGVVKNWNGEEWTMKDVNFVAGHNDYVEQVLPQLISK
jgi:myo-inositol-1(or 4)-monophosphatase